MRILKLTVLAVFLTVPASAITLGEATTEAHQWVLARQEAILDRVETCIVESTSKPKASECHPAWVASVLPNTDPADSQLATVTFDDPGRRASTVCGDCFTGQGTYAQAGINIPATGPLNAKLNVSKAPAGWGVQLVIRIMYDGTIYERGYGRGVFAGFTWREVSE